MEIKRQSHLYHPDPSHPSKPIHTQGIAHISSPVPPPPPTAPLEFTFFALISPVAGLVMTYLACLIPRGLAIGLGGLVKDPCSLCTEALWEKPKVFLFLRSRRQAEYSRCGILDPHFSVPRHFADN
jgi:hypothetical protein